MFKISSETEEFRSKMLDVTNMKPESTARVWPASKNSKED